MVDQVKHIILILSGKGGVGKSTISLQTSLFLRDKGFKVGLLDVDICGPSIPHLLNLEDEDILQGPDSQWIPVRTTGENPLVVMSIGFISNRNNSVVFRGPKKDAVVGRFVTNVDWGALDYLIIDTPPGTSDEHIAVIKRLKEVRCDGAILVTTPQQVSLEDLRKEYTFCQETGISVIGLIENMSGYTCPNCKECTNIFSSEGGQQFANVVNIPFLGKIPIMIGLCHVDNQQNCLAVSSSNSEVVAVFENIVNVLQKL